MSKITYGLSNDNESMEEEIRFIDKGSVVYIEILRFEDDEAKYNISGNIVVNKEDFLKVVEEIKKNFITPIGT